MRASCFSPSSSYRACWYLPTGATFRRRLLLPAFIFPVKKKFLMTNYSTHEALMWFLFFPQRPLRLLSITRHLQDEMESLCQETILQKRTALQTSLQIHRLLTEAVNLN